VSPLMEITSLFDQKAALARETVRASWKGDGESNLQSFVNSLVGVAPEQRRALIKGLPDEAFDFFCELALLQIDSILLGFLQEDQS
jgi:hypothetical protein